MFIDWLVILLSIWGVARYICPTANLHSDFQTLYYVKIHRGKLHTLYKNLPHKKIH